ncbi:zf-HC2 domain-containing protein [Streptomyces niveiscabiei]|uniref:anti-sigma factor family protein n=1 Tax=Streptomyces niveiscabiei TaxID=164115 RepID=UPI0029AFD1A8|nr:zf-HC2 domain-containing protein [Streptomyces niveiscabiei]MDX3384863.1 zf-HC2 domain-containing protein [Streptomyces niveiscabiei]
MNHAEQHLGDRLSALVDGELGHDARERVLAHVATCAQCKAEVDAQRRLKGVFSEVAPPTPSESFLARLQGLPGGDDSAGGSPLGAGLLGGERGARFGSRGFAGLGGGSGALGGGRGSGGFGGSSGAGVFGGSGALGRGGVLGGPVFGARAGEPFEFGYLPDDGHGGRGEGTGADAGAGEVAGSVRDAAASARGAGDASGPGRASGDAAAAVRISGDAAASVRASGGAVSLSAGDTAAAFSASVAEKGFRVHSVGRHEERSRSLRFAFVAAGAVSLAAIALGGVTGSAPIDQTTEARGGAGSNVTPSRAAGAAVPEGSPRRRSAGPLLSQGGQGVLRDTPAAPTEVTAPLLPGIPTPVSARHEETLRALTAPVVAGAAAMSPLIRPLSASWPTTPGLLSPGTTVMP